jgi:hypothetical protein
MLAYDSRVHLLQVLGGFDAMLMGKLQSWSSLQAHPDRQWLANPYWSLLSFLLGQPLAG